MHSRSGLGRVKHTFMVPGELQSQLVSAGSKLWLLKGNAQRVWVPNKVRKTGHLLPTLRCHK